ncbi:peptidase M10A and M12B matrixin and adamalysin [Actinotalea ferrariae CF5-4]|uniref:Peptidase M10A and M12B matrixin and adamalysin n=1 Tax=Actinotalea ferrariae CF5-4 TaxID=948458 RepID=A0A021VUC1_9CELL|nr:matrixin family metalloprotease [Actinotalea ferrariae]EYR63645.1 peptidase M10A and M12B matrixin and adamalysin [Actinotalea ferrariae CF5-4]
MPPAEAEELHAVRPIPSVAPTPVTSVPWSPPQQQSVLRLPFVVALFAVLVAAVLWNAVTGLADRDRSAVAAAPHAGAVPSELEDADDARPRSSLTRLPSPGVDEEPTRLLPAPALPQARGSYAFLFLQDRSPEPVTWSPCRPIRYVINPAGAPDGFAEQVRAVTDELTTATGLVFVDDGTTTETPTLRRAPFQPDRYGDRWAPVLIGFADERGITTLADAVGVATPQVVTVDGTTHLVTGGIYLDTELLEGWRPWGEEPYVSVLRHEFGHALGLDHVDDDGQVMSGSGRHPADFRDGDLRGLAILGTGRCAPDL